MHSARFLFFGCVIAALVVLVGCEASTSGLVDTTPPAQTPPVTERLKQADGTITVTKAELAEIEAHATYQRIVSDKAEICVTEGDTLVAPISRTETRTSIVNYELCADAREFEIYGIAYKRLIGSTSITGERFSTVSNPLGPALPTITPLEVLVKTELFQGCSTQTFVGADKQEGEGTATASVSTAVFLYPASDTLKLCLESTYLGAPVAADTLSLTVTH
jgi:hypothetical protein